MFSVHKFCIGCFVSFWNFYYRVLFHSISFNFFYKLLLYFSDFFFSYFQGDDTFSDDDDKNTAVRILVTADGIDDPVTFECDGEFTKLPVFIFHV